MSVARQGEKGKSRVKRKIEVSARDILNRMLQNICPLRRLRLVSSLVLLPMVLTLSACAGGGMDDLVSYADKIKARKSKQIEPLPEIKVPELYVYASSGTRNPFSRLEPDKPDPDEGTGPTPTTGPTPPDNHVREELEYFTLDSLRMVGTLEMKESLWALVTAPDGAVHRILPGNYLGRNYGKVTMVAEDHLELVEIIQSGGGWQERPAELELTE